MALFARDMFEVISFTTDSHTISIYRVMFNAERQNIK